MTALFPKAPRPNRCQPFMSSRSHWTLHLTSNTEKKHNAVTK